MARISETSVGTVYGRLTVTALSKEQVAICKGQPRYDWVATCSCSCGTPSKQIRLCVINTLVFSCGCLRLEKLKEAVGTHGRAKTDKTYIAYGAMKQRAKDPKHESAARYLGRGISVAPEFLGPEGFDRFLAEVGEHPGKGYSLDRKDNDLGYIPGNLRWATAVEQARNKEKTLKVLFKGNPEPLAQAAEREQLKYQLVYDRLFILNWTVSRALQSEDYTEYSACQL